VSVLYQIIYGIVNFVESTYSALTRVIWDELIHGETNYSQVEAVIGFLLFCLFSVIAFYLEDFVDIAMIIALVSFLYAQLDSLGKRKFKIHQGEPFSSIFNEAFYACSMMTFLVIFANLLPKAGHFIMYFLGPKIDVVVPVLMLDLSLNGIWSIFSFEMDVIDKIEFSMIFISFLVSSIYYLRNN
jgi:hypothetical protein